MTGTEDQDHLQLRVEETIKSIDRQKLNRKELMRMAAMFAIAYSDQRRLVETQDKTIDTLLLAVSKYVDAGKVNAARGAAAAKLDSWMPTILNQYLELAEAVEAFSPLSGIDDQARKEVVQTNAAANRINTGLGLLISRRAKKALSQRTDVILKARQKLDFWDRYLPAVLATPGATRNVKTIKEELAKHDPRCAQILDEWIKQWAKEAGLTLKPGRTKNKN